MNEPATGDSLGEVRALIGSITAEVFSQPMQFRVERDCKDPEHGRIFIQVVYMAPCTVSGEMKEWHGRKWYLSDHMTADEIVKTAFAAFKAAVEHEVHEGFKVNNLRPFNPHASYLALCEAGQRQVFRS